MVNHVKQVLKDCRHAFELLQMETKTDTFRVLWVAGVALARAVGHVLQKVDSKNDESTRNAIAKVYKSWKTNYEENSIFWDFIEDERNQVLKQYEMGFISGPINVLVDNESGENEIFNLDENLYCPLAKGKFASEDCRDVLEEAIKWWENQFKIIEDEIKH